MATLTVEVLHRRRFYVIDEPRLTKVSTNSWSLDLPKDHVIHQRVRRKPTLEGWDGAVFSLNGEESEPCVATGEGRDTISLLIYVL